VLEPCAVKVASTVLRGGGGSNVSLLTRPQQAVVPYSRYTLVVQRKGSEMDQSTKDIIDVVAKSITALSFLLAATGLYFNWRVRKEDLRWRMATAARDALTDLHKNAFAVEAAQMIDCVRWDEQYNAPTALSDLVGMHRSRKPRGTVMRGVRRLAAA